MRSLESVLAEQERQDALYDTPILSDAGTPLAKLLLEALDLVYPLRAARFRTEQSWQCAHDIGQMADVCIEATVKAGPWTREQVIEAWLYQLLQEKADASGIERRPRNSN